MVYYSGKLDTVSVSMENLIEATVERIGKGIDLVDFTDLTADQRQRMIERHINEPSGADVDKVVYDGISIAGNDFVSSRQTHHLEYYDKDTDEAILRSNDIVAAYNALIIGDVKWLSKYKSGAIGTMTVKDGRVAVIGADSETPSGIQNQYTLFCNSVSTLLRYSDILGYDKSQIMDIVCEACYTPSDDPEEIKAVINARIAYNNALISLFRCMLQQNYELLGITKNEADKLIMGLNSNDQKSRQDSIRSIKSALLANENKFRVAGCSYDLRPIGGGVILMSSAGMGSLGVNQAHDIDALIQCALQHDAVIVAHGGSGNLHINSDRMQKSVAYGGVTRDSQTRKRASAHKTAIEISRAKQNYAKLIASAETDELADKLKAELDDRIRELKNAESEANKEIDSNAIKNKEKAIKKYANFEERDKYIGSVWTMEPIYGINGKLYTQMDPLVRDLIRAGYKRIYISSCNPGHHQLAKDILRAPGVTIRHSDRNILIESAYDTADDWSLTETWLDRTEDDLESLCESIGLSYLDETTLSKFSDEYLVESALMITEGALSKVWETLVMIIKKAIAFLVKLFKGIINFFRKIVKKIKDFFTKLFHSGGKSKAKLPKGITSNSIMVENANVKTITTDSWSNVQTAVLRSCESISKKINEVEAKQSKNMQELKRYSENKQKTIQETSNPAYDKLIGLMFP